MNLLFVIKSLNSQGGGAERVLAAVTAELADRGHRVTIATFDRPGTESFYRVAPAVCRVELGIGDAAVQTKTRDFAERAVALRCLVRQFRPDVAIGFMHSSYVPLGFSCVGTGVRVIASEHIGFEHYRLHPVQRFLLRLTVATYAALTGISNDVRARYPEAIKRKMAVIPNPVTTAPNDRADPVGDGRKVLLTVGRLFAQKDHRTLVAAFARLAADHPDWTLRIVGEGELRPDLEAQVRELGLKDRVELPGVIAEVDVEYRRAQLFVMPSRYESFGLATAEALAHGLPAIGFADCPGTNELIRHEVNGLLVEGEDRVSAIAGALDRLMGSPDERVRMAAAAPRSVEQFSLEPIVDQWEALLRQVAH